MVLHTNTCSEDHSQSWCVCYTVRFVSWCLITRMIETVQMQQKYHIYFYTVKVVLKQLHSNKQGKNRAFLHNVCHNTSTFKQARSNIRSCLKREVLQC